MNTSKKVIFFIMFLIISSSISIAQSQNPPSMGLTSFYKLTKPGEYSITVNIWGYVRNPGRYEVPSDCDIVQLMSFAAGPSNHADLSAIKLYRMYPDSGHSVKQDLIMVDLESMPKTNTRPMLLQHGDTIILEPTSYPFWMDVLAVFRDLSWIIVAVATILQVMK